MRGLARRQAEALSEIGVDDKAFRKGAQLSEAGE